MYRIKGSDGMEWDGNNDIAHLSHAVSRILFSTRRSWWRWSSVAAASTSASASASAALCIH